MKPLIHVSRTFFFLSLDRCLDLREDPVCVIAFFFIVYSFATSAFLQKGPLSGKNGMFSTLQYNFFVGNAFQNQFLKQDKAALIGSVSYTYSTVP